MKLKASYYFIIRSVDDKIWRLSVVMTNLCQPRGAVLIVVRVETRIGILSG